MSTTSTKTTLKMKNPLVLYKSPASPLIKVSFFFCFSFFPLLLSSSFSIALAYRSTFVLQLVPTTNSLRRHTLIKHHTLQERSHTQICDPRVLRECCR